MIRSMTGYGRAREVCDMRDVTVEIKSVNHRYFELFTRLPRAYMQLEERVKAVLQTKIVRGKVEVNINIDESAADNREVVVNKQLFEAYDSALRGISTDYSLPYDGTAAMALRFPDVLTVEKPEADIEQIWKDILPVLESALDAFVAQRESEGSRLAADIEAKCGEIKKNVDYIEDRAPELVTAYKDKLRARITDLIGDASVDEQRLLTEVAIMADRLAVDEEVVRLNSHCSALREMFEKGDSNGKKMDFIIQEMNREINTVSSKIGDLDVTNRAIEVKTCIEKIREQVQNIE